MSDMVSQQEVDKERQQEQNPIQKEFKLSGITEGYNLNKEAKESFTRKFNRQAIRKATVEAFALRDAQDKQDAREISLRRGEVMQGVSRNINAGNWGADRESVEANIRAWYDTASSETHANGEYIILDAQLTTMLDRGNALYPKTLGDIAYEDALTKSHIDIQIMADLRETDMDAAIVYKDDKIAYWQQILLDSGSSVSQVTSITGLFENEWSQEENEDLDEKAQTTLKIRKEILGPILNELGDIFNQPPPDGHDNRGEVALAIITEALLDARSMGASEDDIKMLEGSLGSQTGRYNDIVAHNRQGTYNREAVTIRTEVQEWAKEIRAAKDYEEALDIQARLADKKTAYINSIIEKSETLSTPQRISLEAEIETAFTGSIRTFVDYLGRKEALERQGTVEKRADEAWERGLETDRRVDAEYAYNHSPEAKKLRDDKRKLAILRTNSSIESLEEAESLTEELAQSRFLKQYAELYRGTFADLLPSLESFTKIDINPSVGMTFATRATDIVVSAYTLIDDYYTKPQDDKPPTLTEEEGIRVKTHLKEMFTLLESNFERELQSVQDLWTDDLEYTPESENIEDGINNVWNKAVTATVASLNTIYGASIGFIGLQIIEKNLKSMKDPFDGNAIYFEGEVFANGLRITAEPNAQIITSDINRNPSLWAKVGELDVWVGPGKEKDFEDLTMLKYGNKYYEQKEDGMYEIDPESDEGKDKILLYTLSAEQEKDFFQGMLAEERKGDPVSFLLTDFSGLKSDNLLENLVGVPLLTGEKVSKDTPVPKSRWDRLIDSAYENQTINTQESEMLNTMKGVLMAMSHHQKRDPDYVGGDEDEFVLKDDIAKIMRVAVEIIYSKDVGRGGVPGRPGLRTLEEGKQQALPGIYEEEFVYARRIGKLREVLGEMKDHYGVGSWWGMGELPQRLPLREIEAIVGTSTAEPVVEAVVEPVVEAETKYISKSATLGMERKQESKGPGADVPPREKPYESYVGVGKK